MSAHLIGFAMQFVLILVKLLYWAILIQVLMSWFAAGRTPLGQSLDQIVQPVLKPFRWARIGMLDLSPIVALYALHFLQGVLLEFLARFL